MEIENSSPSSMNPWWQVADLPLKPEQVEQLQHLASLFREWNERLNLVSRKDMADFEVHHLTHSLLMARLLPWGGEAGRSIRVLDVGTGGGLPGLPLAIVFPEVRFFLCDSMTKKVMAVQKMVDALGLKNVEVVHKRAENLESKWEFVIGRAVTALPNFLRWTTKNLRPGGTEAFPHGVLYLKGTLYEEELGGIDLKPFRVHDLSEATEDPYFEGKFLLHLDAATLIARDDLKLPPPPPKKKAKKKKKKKKGGVGGRDVWGELKE